MKFDGVRRERIIASPQFDGRVFRNRATTRRQPQEQALSIIPEFLFGGARRRPKHPLPLSSPQEDWLRPVRSGLRTTWLGHSTVLLEVDGLRVLTDPVFGQRASPSALFGPKRFHPPPARLSELPPLDAVVISHDHFDHLCASTVAELARTRDVPIVTSLGVGARLERMGIESRRILELDWGESCDVKGLRFVATPSWHFSGRGLSDRNATLWSSWVIQTDRHKVFFSGDTGWSDQFREIGDTYGPFDLVLLEIGAYHPSFEGIHLGPENALDVLRMLGGGTLLPIHWGTFDLALHPWDEPAETLVRLAAESGQRVITPQLGEVVEPEHCEGPSPWWREVAASKNERIPLAVRARSM